MRAVVEKRELLVRNPDAVRPWQHVIDPLCGYLTLAEKVWLEPERFSGAWNFGPDENGNVERERRAWPSSRIMGKRSYVACRREFAATRVALSQTGLQQSAQRACVGTGVGSENALAATVSWFKAYQRGEDLRQVTLEQLRSYQRAVRVPETVRT